jgi:hypothetical protein
MKRYMNIVTDLRSLGSELIGSPGSGPGSQEIVKNELQLLKNLITCLGLSRIYYRLRVKENFENSSLSATAKPR